MLCKRPEWREGPGEPVGHAAIWGRAQLSEEMVITIIFHHPCLHWVGNPSGWEAWEASTLGWEVDNWGNKWLVPLLYFSFPTWSSKIVCLFFFNVVESYRWARKNWNSLCKWLAIPEAFGNNYLAPQNHSPTHVLPWRPEKSVVRSCYVPCQFCLKIW